MLEKEPHKSFLENIETQSQLTFEVVDIYRILLILTLDCKSLIKDIVKKYDDVQILKIFKDLYIKNKDNFIEYITSIFNNSNKELNDKESLFYFKLLSCYNIIKINIDNLNVNFYSKKSLTSSMFIMAIKEFFEFYGVIIDRKICIEEAEKFNNFYLNKACKGIEYYKNNGL